MLVVVAGQAVFRCRSTGNKFGEVGRAIAVRRRAIDLKLGAETVHLYNSGCSITILEELG